jgi:Tol biopolymer transport system component
VSSPDLAARLDALFPPELACGDWADVTRRVRPRRHPLLLKVAVALALFVVLAAAATATYLALRGHPVRTPAPGALTLSEDGHSTLHPPGIVEVLPGGGLRDVWRCPAKPCGGYLTSVAWAPDGRHVAFTLDAFNFRDPVLGLHILDTRTGRDRHVGGAEGARLGCRRTAPGWTSYAGVAWSPDSRTVAFTCANGIHTVRADLTQPRRVRTGLPESGVPAWSPDGSRIAFQSAGWIYVMRVDGSGRRRVARGEAPDWSPEGSRLAYRAAHGIRMVTPAGVDVTPGGRALVPAGVPKWSPDGTKLAISTRQGVYVLSLVRGRPRAVLVAGPATGAYGPAWYPLRRGRQTRETSDCGTC